MVKSLEISLSPIFSYIEKYFSGRKILICKELTKGLGAGANSEIGEQAVMENKEIIAKELNKADMIFITAGMCGGTGKKIP